MCGGGPCCLLPNVLFPAGTLQLSVSTLHSPMFLHTVPTKQESELTPTGSNLLDGRYAVFGYVTENQNLLQDLKVWVWTLCMSCCTVCLALEETLCIFIHPP